MNGLANGNAIAKDLWADTPPLPSPPAGGTPGTPLHATRRIGDAIAILRGPQRDIETRWPNYAERQAELKELGCGVEVAIVDLERCHREDALDVDRMVDRAAERAADRAAERAAEVAETIARG